MSDREGLRARLRRVAGERSPLEAPLVLMLVPAAAAASWAQLAGWQRIYLAVAALLVGALAAADLRSKGGNR